MPQGPSGFRAFLLRQLLKFPPAARLYRDTELCNADEDKCNSFIPLEAPIGWSDKDKIELLKEQMSIAASLVTHEDQLNWSKLNNMFYINLGLATAFALVLRPMDSSGLNSAQRLFLIAITLVGIFTSIGFYMTLYSGKICLRGHKNVVRTADRAFSKLGVTRIVLAKPHPFRFMLWYGPVVSLGFWVVLVFAAFLKTGVQATELVQSVK